MTKPNRPMIHGVEMYRGPDVDRKSTSMVTISANLAPLPLSDEYFSSLLIIGCSDAVSVERRIAGPFNDADDLGAFFKAIDAPEHLAARRYLRAARNARDIGHPLQPWWFGKRADSYIPARVYIGRWDCANESSVAAVQTLHALGTSWGITFACFPQTSIDHANIARWIEQANPPAAYGITAGDDWREVAALLGSRGFVVCDPEAAVDIFAAVLIPKAQKDVVTWVR